MRKWYVPLAIVLGCVVWFANASTEAQTQVRAAGLTRGERVTLQIDSAQVLNHTVDCEVMSVSAEFLGCAADKSNGVGAFDRSAHESWYNLRFVIRIDRPVKE